MKKTDHITGGAKNRTKAAKEAASMSPVKNPVSIKKIGIITSGGDCGGLNGVVKGAALMAASKNIECYIIPNGYAGLYNLIDFDKDLLKLTPERTDDISVALAGSEAGHSRVKISKIDDEKKYERIKKGLKKFAIDGLLISGGDDTGSVVIDLMEQGIPCVHAPKTMDLDLQTYSVGADSTINRIAQYANDLKTTGRTHNRIIVLEAFGRYAGHTAFRGGIASDSDAILIPEIPVDFDILYEHMKKRYFRRIFRSDNYTGTYLIVVAEGLKNASGEELYDTSSEPDSFGHRKLAGAAKFVCQELTARLKEDKEIMPLMKKAKMFVKGAYEIPEVRSVCPGHLVRSGHSSAFDANFGLEAGAAGVELLAKGITGVTISGLNGSVIEYLPTKDAIVQRYVDLDLVQFYENLGTCFGRKPLKHEISSREHQSIVKRHL